MNYVSIIINEQHSLLPEQENLIKNKFPNHEMDFVKIPCDGWKASEIIECAMTLCAINNPIVIVSPIPLLFKELNSLNTDFFIFHNDERIKKELPNGKIISVVAQTGWELY